MKQKKPVKPKYYNSFQLNMLLKDTCFEETVTFNLKMGNEYAFSVIAINRKNYSRHLKRNHSVLNDIIINYFGFIYLFIITPRLLILNHP